MRDLGTYSLVATLILALGAAWLLALGAWSGSARTSIRYGYYAVYGFFLTTVIASAVLLQAFLKGDFSFAYVVENSDTSLVRLLPHRRLLGRAVGLVPALAADARDRGRS